MKKAKISVCLATFNEEENLPGCLESVRSLAYEIVVVDGESTDKTRKIAKSFGARVFKAKNLPIFHINKQKAIEKARGDWILQLDADEQVTKKLKKEIQLAISHQPSAINGFYIPRRNYFLGRWLRKGGQYPDYVIRLFKNGKGYLPCKSVHEQIVIRGKVDYLKEPLIHLSDPNLKKYFRKFFHYTTLDAEGIRREKGVLKPVNYLLVKPVWWFLKTYIRHKGFLDSWQGFLFSFLSSLHFPVAFLKSLPRTYGG